MIYVRGSRHDYDRWETEGWSYKEVLPYFLKIEDMKIADLVNSAYHSTGGYLPLTRTKATSLPNVYERVVEELGYKTVDVNGEDHIGIFSFAGNEGHLFDKSTKGNHSLLYPDYQLQFYSGTSKGNDVPANTGLTFNFNESVLEEAARRSDDNEIIIFPMLFHPKSIGSMKLKSKDPFDHPLINPNYLSQQDDVYILIEAVRKVQMITQTKPFQEMGATLNRLDYEGVCDREEFDSDVYWECLIRHYAVTAYHPTCTCRIGGTNDQTSVVDTKLSYFKGIRNLRIADASVMRHVTSGNTNAPTIMIAEKAADLIRGKDTVIKYRKQIKQLRL
ncbi:unnamed protein product [Mytilus coruscus]|uniref:Glucose-methanol-choline oxidoreductase C-terminal domain-containing protein n=1 Tax=Mytilus coruscus TaxID=42192 RepID=A0A6J8A7D7_MYTCO|nr:unnamed protein product [Mytilus coruscus]